MTNTCAIALSFISCMFITIKFYYTEKDCDIALDADVAVWLCNGNIMIMSLMKHTILYIEIIPKYIKL